MPELITTNMPLRAVKAGDAINFKDDNPEHFAIVVRLDKKQVWGRLFTEKGDPEGTQYKLDRMVWVQRMQPTKDERAAQHLENVKRHISTWIQGASDELLTSGTAIADAMKAGHGLLPNQVERRYIAERTYAYSRDLDYDLGGRGPQDENLSEQDFYSKVLRRWQNRLTQEALRELRSDGGSICYRAQNKGFAEALTEMLRRVENWADTLDWNN